MAVFCEGCRVFKSPYLQNFLLTAPLDVLNAQPIYEDQRVKIFYKVRIMAVTGRQTLFRWTELTIIDSMPLRMRQSIGNQTIALLAPFDVASLSMKELFVVIVFRCAVPSLRTGTGTLRVACRVSSLSLACVASWKLNSLLICFRACLCLGSLDRLYNGPFIFTTTETSTHSNYLNLLPLTYNEAFKTRSSQISK